MFNNLESWVGREVSGKLGWVDVGGRKGSQEILVLKNNGFVPLRSAVLRSALLGDIWLVTACLELRTGK